MSSFVVSIVIELLVAGLLAVTIGYCVALNRRLLRLKADEQALKATIGELITATEIAERAIQGLKVTVRECDATLGERLRLAERFVGEIEREVASGRDVLDKVARITQAARAAREADTFQPAPVVAPQPVAVSHAGQTLAAATAFAARIQGRAH